jgi:hypothetical protein
MKYNFILIALFVDFLMGYPAFAATQYRTAPRINWEKFGEVSTDYRNEALKYCEELADSRGDEFYKVVETANRRYICYTGHTVE